MKIKDAKQILAESDQMMKDSSKFFGVDNAKYKELSDAAMSHKTSLPAEFKSHHLLKTLEEDLKNIFSADADALESVDQLVRSVKHFAAPGLEHFDDELDVEKAVQRANKLKALM